MLNLNTAFFYFVFIFSSTILNSQIQNDNLFTVNKVYDSQNQDDFRLDNELEKVISEIDRTLLEYRVLDIKVNNIHQHVRLNPTSSFQLTIENKNIQLDLYLYDILAADFRHVEQTAMGELIHPKPKPFTYRGMTNGRADQSAVFTIRDNWLSGFYTVDNQQFFLTPLKQFSSKNTDHNLFVLYKSSDSKSPSFECHVGHSNPEPDLMDRAHGKHSLKSLAVQCTEMGVAYDQGFKTLHGGAIDVQNIIISRLNLVSSLYRDWFQIDYVLSELYEADLNEITPEDNFESCQENFPDCSENTILDDFREWGEGQAESPNFGIGFSSTPDVATFWTSRDIRDGSNDLNIGYSHFEGICNERGYNICEDAVRYRGNEALQMTLWAHELGHTWNAYHVNQDATYMMNSSVTAEAINVAGSTLISIADHKASRTCLDNNPCTPHCSNGIQDADETGIDCGGLDCISCPTCTDGLINGNETGVDCGGPDCADCPFVDCAVLNFNSSPVIGYDPSEDQGTATIQEAGVAVLLEDNAWKAVQINYNVTTETILTFEFKSTQQGELHEIAFDNDLDFSFSGPEYRARVYGDQSFGVDQGFGGFLTVNNYSGSGSWESFQVDIGSEFTGVWAYLILSADDDGNGTLGNSYFRNIRIFEDFNNNQVCDECTSPVGSVCDDNDVCTTNDVYDINCDCAGTFQDADNDGVCDTDDICAGGDDNMDGDGDGIPDFCDSCDGSLNGSTCNDNDVCTTNDVYDINCDCAGTFQDTDNDGVCDTDDICAGGDDNMDGDGDGIPDFCDIPDGGCVILESDDFEIDAGIWVSGGSDAGRVNSSFSPSGDYSMRIRDNSFNASSIYTASMDLSQQDLVKINFDFQAVGMETGKSFFLEVSDDNGSTFTIKKEWTSGVDFANNTIYSETIDFDQQDISSTSVFQFRCNGRINADEIYLDNIKLESCDLACEDYIIENQNVVSNSNQSAALGIETNNIIISGFDFEYTAGQYILLKSGFEVEAQASFHAYIEGCQD